MQKTVLVTGANGFIGKYLVKLLAETDHIIYAMVHNKNSDISGIVNILNVKLVYCDMAENDMLIEKLSGIQIDSLYHLAWTGSSGLKRENYEDQLNNVKYTMQLIEVAKELDIKKIIFAGSITQIMYRNYLTESYIKPEMITCYAIAKMTCEYMAKCLCTKLGIDMNWTYISNFYGIGDQTNNFIKFLVNSYKCGKVPALTSGKQKADFIYVSDVAQALLSIDESGIGGRSYYIGYGSPRPLYQYVQQIHDIVNKDCDTGLAKKEFNGQDIDFEQIDINELQKDTGFKPMVDFSEGIWRMLESEEKSE